MDVNTTLIVGGMTLAFAVFCGWRGARKPDPSKNPRLIPWRALMVSAAMVLLLLLNHLVNINRV